MSGYDYLPEGVVPIPRDYVIPEPGTGTVFVGPPNADGSWDASWQGPGMGFVALSGSEAEVVAWALVQPAEKRLICRQESAGDRIWNELLESK